MSIALQLRNLLRSGIHRIGELELQTDVYGFPYVICHYTDAERATDSAFGGLVTLYFQQISVTLIPVSAAGENSK